MNFKKDRYTVIKNIISKDLAQFLFNYLNVKKQVFYTMRRVNYISPFDHSYGVHGDFQVPDTWSCYGDIAMDTLLLKCQNEIEKKTKLKLISTYSYARLYKKGDILKRHKDRESCEITTTLFLGVDKWPIFLDTNKKHGKFDGDDYIPGNSKGKKIDLNQGDILVYYGNDLEHWREKFNKKECGQVFFHFNTSSNKNPNTFDGRPHLGLPAWFQDFNKKFKA